MSTRERIHALILFLLLSTAALAAIPPGTKRTLDLPVEEWLKQPDPQDFPMKLRIMPPQLTFEQRQLVRVVARLDAKALQRKQIQRELHFIVKVAEGDGNWYTEESYATTSLREKFKNEVDVELLSEIYFEPGDYIIAVIVYDSLLKERSVARQRLRVSAIEDDPLPRLNQELPAVEFLPEAQPGSVPVGNARRHLPLRASRPLLIDLVIDFGAYRYGPVPKLHKLYSGWLAQTASLLSQMRPERGCIAVSAVDVLRLEVLFQRQNAEELRWQDLRQQILARNLNAIDARVLASRQQAAAGLGHFLRNLMAGPPACGQQGDTPERVIIILAGGIAFPPGTPIQPVEPQPGCACRIYYLRQIQNVAYPFDDIPRLLKRLDARKIEISNPGKFRKQLAELFASFGTAGQKAGN